MDNNKIMSKDGLVEVKPYITRHVNHIDNLSDYDILQNYILNILILDIGDFLPNCVHVIKSHTERFHLLWNGSMKAEIRTRDTDKPYKENDICVMIDGFNDMGIWVCSGNILLVRISHIDTFSMPDQYSVLLNYDIVCKIRLLINK